MKNDKLVGLLRNNSLKLIDDLKVAIEKLQYDKDYAWEQYRLLKEEYNKDEEIQKLKNKIKSLQDETFLTFTDKERRSYDDFNKKHYKQCNWAKTKDASYVECYGTGLGTIIKVKCPICQEVEDITDIESW